MIFTNTGVNLKKYLKENAKNVKYITVFAF